MALDKVVDSAVLDAGMLSVADAIRAKTGDAKPLVWPDGFSAAISGIKTGDGGGGVSLDSVVVFVGDYYADELTVDIGALDKYERTIVT